MYMDVLHVPMFVHHVHAWCPRRTEEGVRSRVRVTDSCEPLYSSRKQAQVLWKSSSPTTVVSLQHRARFLN